MVPAVTKMRVDLGRTVRILDNLIAEGKAKPMIVMPNGVYFKAGSRCEYVPAYDDELSFQFHEGDRG